MMMYFGDPYEAFDRYDRDSADVQERFEKSCPICQLCGEPITDDYCYVLTSSEDVEEQMCAAVHCTCVKMRPITRSDKMRELLTYLFEDYCYKNTPRREEE